MKRMRLKLKLKCVRRLCVYLSAHCEQRAIQNSGADNSGLQAQFVRFLATVKIKLGGTLEQIFDLGPDKRKIRDESFFLPPKVLLGAIKLCI